MARMTGKEIRAQLDKLGGRIEMEVHGNLVLPGFEDIHAKMVAARVAAAPKAKTDGSMIPSTPVNMRFSMRNRVDVSPPDPIGDAYHQMDRVPVVSHDSMAEPVPATYEDPFEDPGVAAGEDPTGFWFNQSFTSPVVGASTLLYEVIQKIAMQDLSYVIDPQFTGPPKLPTVNLKTLEFGGNLFDLDSGYYDLVQDPETLQWSGRWIGWSFMYYIGTPQHPVSGQPQPHGPEGLPNGSYPGLTLGEYDVATLVSFANQQAVGVGNAFTLSYERVGVAFGHETTTENGELVHKIKISHIKK